MIDELVDTLREKQALNEGDAEKVRRLCQENRSGFAEALVESKIVTERELLEALSLIYAVPFSEEMSLSNLADDFAGNIAMGFLKKFCIAPIIKENTTPIIAVNNPADLSCVDDLSALLGLDSYRLVLAPRNFIYTVINTLYNSSRESAQQLVEDLEEDSSRIIEEIEQTADLLDDTSNAPVIKLVNHMISQAVKAGASDIHIEPYQETLKVRYRIDGILYEMLSPPKHIQSALISRVKVMANMNIAEKRVPQDGRFEVKTGGDRIDIRISTVPTSFGERLVMRLLNKSGYFLALSEFGLSPENFDLIRHIIAQNNGMVLVTGPTGSGKTTTLYAALSEINSPEKNIITIEDPVEYNIKGIGQIQVNRKKGVTFAKGLRSIVRQDPDVVLVGEIRDLETAEIAIQSALTGHLVFSTLHTNDSAGAVTRLVDIGVEPYLISSSVNSVIAQRLVRVLCPHCREAYRLGEADIKSLNGTGDDLLGARVYKARGCPECFNTGYHGRQAIFEIMLIDEKIKDIILTTSDANRIKEAAIRQGMVTLRHDGMAKVLSGTTTINEVLRVTQD